MIIIYMINDDVFNNDKYNYICMMMILYFVYLVHPCMFAYILVEIIVLYMKPNFVINENRSKYAS